MNMESEKGKSISSPVSPVQYIERIFGDFKNGWLYIQGPHFRQNIYLKKIIPAEQRFSALLNARQVNDKKYLSYALHPFYFQSPRAKKDNRKYSCLAAYVYDVDIDEAVLQETPDIHDIILNTLKQNDICPNYIVKSGTGLHLVFKPTKGYMGFTPANYIYYILRKMLQETLQLLPVKIDNVGPLQAFRMPGLLTKKGAVVQAFETGISQETIYKMFKNLADKAYPIIMDYKKRKKKKNKENQPKTSINTKKHNRKVAYTILCELQKLLMDMTLKYITEKGQELYHSRNKTVFLALAAAKDLRISGNDIKKYAEKLYETIEMNVSKPYMHKFDWDEVRDTLKYLPKKQWMPVSATIRNLMGAAAVKEFNAAARAIKYKEIGKEGANRKHILRLINFLQICSEVKKTGNLPIGTSKDTYQRRILLAFNKIIGLEHGKLIAAVAEIKKYIYTNEENQTVKNLFDVPVKDQKYSLKNPENKKILEVIKNNILDIDLEILKIKIGWESKSGELFSLSSLSLPLSDISADADISAENSNSAIERDGYAGTETGASIIPGSTGVTVPDFNQDKKTSEEKEASIPEKNPEKNWEKEESSYSRAKRLATDVLLNLKGFYKKLATNLADMIKYAHSALKLFCSETDDFIKTILLNALRLRERSLSQAARINHALENSTIPVIGSWRDHGIKQILDNIVKDRNADLYKVVEKFFRRIWYKAVRYCVVRSGISSIDVNDAEAIVKIDAEVWYRDPVSDILKRRIEQLNFRINREYLSSCDQNDILLSKNVTALRNEQGLMVKFLNGFKNLYAGRQDVKLLYKYPDKYGHFIEMVGIAG